MSGKNGSPPQGRSLFAAHRITIGLSIVFCASMSVGSGLAWRSTGSSTSLALALASGAAAVGLGLYLRWFWRKHRRS